MTTRGQEGVRPTKHLQFRPEHPASLRASYSGCRQREPSNFSGRCHQGLTDADLAKSFLAILLSRQTPQETPLSDASAHYRKAPPFRIASESKWFIVLLAMIVTLPSFSIDSCLASLSNIGLSLHAPPAATALVLSLFMMGFGCGQVIFGPLCARFGRRPPLLLGCLIFTAASVGCAIA